MRRSSSSFHINLIHKYSFIAASYKPLNAADEIACISAFAFRLNGALTSTKCVILGQKERGEER